MRTTLYLWVTKIGVMGKTMTRISKFFAFALFFLTLSVSGGASAEGTPEVKVTDIVIGTGAPAILGARVKVHYTGWTMDGKQFDTSRDSNTPFGFSVGAHEVIRGWDIGVQGMQVGGKRELVIPPELAYGKKGYLAIGPNATLKFEIELMESRLNEFTFIENKELEALLKRNVPIVDLRRQSEWDATGIIEGSHLITAFLETSGFSPTFLRTLKATVGKTDEFIMISSVGRRSAYLSQVLSDRKGYTNIYNVKKGINKWIKEGYPVVKP